MTSGIRFESSDLLEERRQDLRDAREKVLEKAKKQYDIEERKKEEARLRGEDKWLLPSVDSRITKETQEISSKKKKSKKEKKKKKKKKKSKNSSSECEEDEWVEAGIKDSGIQDNKTPVVKGPTMPQRESWMEAPLDFMPLTSRQDIRDKKKAEEEKAEKKESVIEQMGQHARELNPYWKDGGVGLPSEDNDKKKSLSEIGDGGLTWLKQSYLRCKEQARTEGKSFEELASERWGSVKKIEKMIADAEKAAGKTTSLYEKTNRDGRLPNFQRRSSRDDDGGRRFQKPSSVETEYKSHDRHNDQKRFQRPSSPNERKDKFKDQCSPDRSRNNLDRQRSKSPTDRRKFRRPSPEDDRKISRRSESPEEKKSRKSLSKKSRSKSPEQRRFRRPSPDDSRSRWSGSRSSDQRRFRRPSPDDSRSKRSRSKSQEGRKFRRSSPEDTGSKSRSRSSERRGFRKPSSDRSRSHRSRSPDKDSRNRGNRRDDRTKESYTPRWKKKDPSANKPSSEDLKTMSKSSPSPSRKLTEKPESKKRSNSSSSSENSSSSSESSPESEEEEVHIPPPAILTEGEMNTLAAKILKAEIMGNEAQASELKAKLEAAREARKNASPPPPKSEAKDGEDDEVLLTRTTKSGIVIPLSDPKHRKEPKKGRKRQKKIATHEDGDRQRYFDDDDKLDLKTMVEREKMGTAEDQNAMFARLAGRSVEKTDDDYQVDDMFISKAARQQSEAKLEEKDRSRAIMEHQKMASAMSKCQFCFDKVPKHLIIAIGKKSYLCLPHHKPLTVGHCLIVPMMHSTSCTAIDEDVWQEMQLFRKTLANLFREKDDEDTIFMETSMYLKRHPHTYIECVPLEREVGDLAPIYFKKAIQDTETEWAQNKKLVDLSKKDIRHSVPKGFPYFAVDFGLQGGFAHVIEDEHRFPTYFGREIVGGMIDASHRLWKNPPKESFDEQRIRVLEFSEWWRPHDWTQNIG